MTSESESKTMQSGVVRESVMDLLRESTKELHSSAEANQFQHRLGNGSVDRDDYCRYLQQLYRIHHEIARLLSEKRSLDAALERVVQDYHLDLTCLTNDLSHFGVEPDQSTPLDATNELIVSLRDTARTAPALLLGYLYVLEGSTNGAKFLARSLKNGLSLPEHAGASYFDRYGDKQRERWMKFKADMNEINFSESERKTLVEKAKETFHSFGKIGNQLLAKQ